MPITTTPSGGPQGEFSTYTPIYSQTLSATATSVTFSNIPTTYTDLVLVVNATSSADANIYIRVGNNSIDSGSNYSYTYLSGDGTTATSGRGSTTVMVGTTTGGSLNAKWANSIIHFMNYANITTFKTAINRTNSVGSEATANVGLWRNTAAINQIQITTAGANIYSSGSTFTLYGIKAAATQFIPTKAGGGDVVVSDGTYAYHVFKSSGIFAPAKSLSCDVLQVAGGGGGGFGGGGAGGLRYFASESLTATSYTVTVGAGGQAGASGATGSNGSNSQLGSLTVSTGGGGGGSIAGSDGNAGGSGGGGGASDPSGYSGGGASPAGQGNSGGSGSARNAGYGGAGGGGGAGAGGGNAGNTSGGGAGGVGVTNSTINTLNAIGAATLTGQLSGGNYYYAGGGGGSANLYPAGSGGLGGGGNGYRGTGTVPGSPGLLNTGGGGGGVYNTTNNYTGGSGIVIVRYLLNA